MAPLADVLVGAGLAYRLRAEPGRRLARMLTGLEAGLRLDAVKVFALSPEPPNAPRTRGAVDAIVAGLSATGEF